MLAVGGLDVMVVIGGYNSSNTQALTHPGGQFLVVKDRPEAEIVCDFILGKLDAGAIVERFHEATSPGFEPERDLQKIGLANQTTMLMTESLEIQELLRAASP